MSRFVEITAAYQVLKIMRVKVPDGASLDEIRRNPEIWEEIVDETDSDCTLYEVHDAAEEEDT